MVFGRGTLPIGLDVGSRCIKAAQVRRRAGGYELVGSLVIERSGGGDGAEIARALGALARQGFEGRRCVCAIGKGALVSGVFELPPRSSGAPVDELAMVELCRSSALEEGSCEVSCWDLPGDRRGGEMTGVLAVGCSHADANELIEEVGASGAIVEAVDVGACALARSCGHLIVGGEAIGAIVDVGWSGVELVLMHAGCVVYERTLDAPGFGEIVKEAGEVLGFGPRDTIESLLRPAKEPDTTGAVDRRTGNVSVVLERFGEQIAKELALSFEYGGRRYGCSEVSGAVLAGGGSGCAGLESVLGDRLGVRVSVASFGEVVRGGEGLDGVHACALGLAMHGGGRGFGGVGGGGS